MCWRLVEDGYQPPPVAHPPGVGAMVVECSRCGAGMDLRGTTHVLTTDIGTRVYRCTDRVACKRRAVRRGHLT